MSTVGLDNELLSAAVERRAGDRLSSVRAAALSRFVDSGLPGTKHEDWRYTNLKPVAELGNRWLAGDLEGTETDASRPDPASVVDAHWLIIEDGRPDAASLDRLLTEVGASIRVDLLSQSDERPAISMEEPLSSLNAALVDEIVRIELPAGARLDKPIGIALLSKV